MTNLAGATEALVARIAAAGIRATTDERDVNPPCVIVPAPAVVFRFGGCWDGTWPLLVVVPDGGRIANLVALADLVDAVQVAVDGAIKSGRPVAVTGVEGAPPLPGYELTYTETID